MTNTKQDTTVEAVAALTVTEADGTTWLNVSTDPAAVERLGAAIADQVSDLGATALVSWFDPDETVLAHVTARELGVPRAAVELDLGLLTLSPEFSGSQRVVLLTTSSSLSRPVESLRTLLEGKGHVVAGTISIDPASGGAISTLDS